MTALGYVGAAYACIWLLLFVYVWRLTASTKNLEKKLEELERDAS
jgi:CcmD family protein